MPWGQCTKVKTSLGRAQHPHRRLESAAAHLGPSGMHKRYAAAAKQLLPSLLLANRLLATHSPRQRARTACEAAPPQDCAPPRERRAARRLAPHPRRRQGANSRTSRRRRTAAAKPPLRARAAAATRHRPSARAACRRAPLLLQAPCPQCQRRESLRRAATSRLHRRVSSSGARGRRRWHATWRARRACAACT